MSEKDYPARVIEVLASNPTSADLDFLIEAFTNLGYLAADAAGKAEMAEAKRKFEEASAFDRFKKSGEKMTDSVANARATIETWPFKKEEIDAQTKARKLHNLLAAVEQAINGIKHLDKNTGYTMSQQAGVKIGGLR